MELYTCCRGFVAKMFSKHVLPAQLLALLTIIAVILAYPIDSGRECSCQAIVYDTGYFETNITSTRSKYSSLYHDIVYVGVYRSNYMKYNITYRIGGNSGNTGYYREEFIVRGDNGLLTGLRRVFGEKNNTLLKINASFNIVLHNSNVWFKQLVFEISTNDYVELLNWNITLAQFLLILRNYDEVKVYDNLGSGGNNYKLRIIVRGFNATYDDLGNDNVREILGLPGDLDPSIVFSHGTRFVNATSKIWGNMVFVERILNISGLTFFTRGENYVVPLIGFGDQVIIASTKHVLLDLVTWRIQSMDNYLLINVLVKGIGVGFNNEEKIKSVLENIIFLSGIYGCFKVSAVNFYFISNGELRREVIVSNNTSVLNVQVVFNKKEESIQDLLL